MFANAILGKCAMKCIREMETFDDKKALHKSEAVFGEFDVQELRHFCR